MKDDHPHLTLVDPSEHDQEFVPLPYYPWDERPHTLPLDADECATALYLAHGEPVEAAELLKVPLIRLNRLIRNSPRLKTVIAEALEEVLARAAHVPIKTLFDPEADNRRLEWASSLVLKSRLAASHALSPNPAGAAAASLSVDTVQRSITFRWRTDADDAEG